MNKLYRYNERATVCAKNNCVTVYGETARIVNTIAVFTAAIIAIALIAKAVR
jgi:hypothetical protein